MSNMSERESLMDEDESGEQSAEIGRDFSDEEGEVDDRPIKCPECPNHKGFKNRKCLSRHIANVHSEKRFECPECSKKFACKSKLNIHMKRVHTAERPFKCEFDGCDKTYADEQKLNQHKFVHGEKLQVCAYCQKKFHYSSQLNRHIKISHSEHAEKHETFRQSFTNSSKLMKKNSEKKESQDVVMHEKTLPEGQIAVKENKRVFDKIPSQRQPTAKNNLVILVSQKHTLNSDSTIAKYWIRQCGLTVSEAELASRKVSEDSAVFRYAIQRHYTYLQSSDWTVSTNEDLYFFIGPKRNLTAERYKLNSQITQLLKSYQICETDQLELKSEVMEIKLKIYSKYGDPVIFASFLESNNIRLIFEDGTTNPDFNKINWPINLALRKSLPKVPTIYQMVWFMDDTLHLYIGLNPTGEGTIASTHSNSITDPTAAGEFARANPSIHYSAATVVTCRSKVDPLITEGVCVLAIFLASQSDVKLRHDDGKYYPIRLLNKDILTPTFLLDEHYDLMQLATLKTLGVKIKINRIQPNNVVKERVVFPGLLPGEFLECQGEEILEECSDDEDE